MDGVKNPIVGYADSYRLMQRDGAKTIDIWSIITDLERNMIPAVEAELAALREELATLRESYELMRDRKNSIFDLQQRLIAAEQRNAELQKAHDAQQLLALIRLADLRDNNVEFEKLYDLLRSCYPFVRARCEATDFGDASARTTLEMINEAFKRIEQKPTESGASE